MSTFHQRPQLFSGNPDNTLSSSSIMIILFLWLELRLETGLLADFVCSNPIEVSVAFDGNYLGSIRIDRMVATFP